MEIKLESPYKEHWKKGYLVTNSENRKTVILYNNPEERSSTQFARYKLAVHLGKYLPKDATIDHIDGDKTNDSIDNLQILSRNENIRKSSKGKVVEKHGTLSMYRYCKCDLCRKAKREYMAKYKNK